MSLSAPRPALVSLVALSCLACATLGGQSAIRSQLDAYRFQKPIAEVWTVAIRMLSNRGWHPVAKDRELIGLRRDEGTFSFLAKGFETRTHDDGRRVLETRENGKWVRYRVEGKDLGDGTCELRITSVRRHPETAATQEEGRDLQLELELIELVDPAAAARIVESTKK